MLTDLETTIARQEIEEAITHAAAYAGFPAGHAAMGVAVRIFAEANGGKSDGIPADQPF